MKAGSDGLQGNGKWAALQGTSVPRVLLGGALINYRLGSSHERTGPHAVWLA